MTPDDQPQPSPSVPSTRVSPVKIQSLSTGLHATVAATASGSVPMAPSLSLSAPVTVLTGATAPAPVSAPYRPAPELSNLHAQPPAKPVPALVRYWRQVGGGSLFLSLVVHAVLLAAAYFIVSTIVNPEKPVDFLPGGGSKAGENASQTLANTMRQNRRKTVTQHVPMQKIVSRNSTSAIQLPDIPMESMDLPEISGLTGSMGGGGFGGLGGSGGGFGGGHGIGGAKGFTPMTFFGRVGGEGLPGAFYDMKQDRDKKPLPYSGQFPDYIAVINKAASKRFSPTSLKDYYKANQEVSFTYLLVPNMAATEGPKCFNVEKEVEPRGWFVHYTGMVTPPKPGTYRFVGFFDDLLIVYINNKPVLDGSWVPMAGVGEGKYDDELRQEFKGPPVAGSRTAYAGKWVKMGSEPFKLDIVVGETPGGRVGGLLMVQDKNGKYEERADGTPILPIFATTKLEADDLKRLKDDPYARAVQLAPDPPVFPGKRATFDKDNQRGLGLLPERTARQP